ncbi:hypothetical protein AAC387_Pa01g2462 [Persea americana]
MELVEKSSQPSSPGSHTSIAPSSRDPPIFHQIRESSHSKDRGALEAPTRQEKDRTDVLRLLALSYVSDYDSSKLGSATYPSLPSFPCSVPATILSAFRDSVISPSRQNSNEDLFSISKKTNSISSPCTHRHSAPADNSYLPGSPISRLPQKIRACGEAIGISVDSNNGGWESPIAFAKDRDSTLGRPVTQKKKSKRKGSREL